MLLIFLKQKKIYHGKLWWKFFNQKEPSYSSRSWENYFVRGNVKSFHCVVNSIKEVPPKIRDLVLDQIKHCEYLIKFKNFPKWLSLSAMQNIHCTSKLNLIRSNSEIRWLGHYNEKYFSNIRFLFQFFVIYFQSFLVMSSHFVIIFSHREMK